MLRGDDKEIVEENGGGKDSVERNGGGKDSVEEDRQRVELDI